jgi:flagellar hook-associated protein 1 FlgK
MDEEMSMLLDLEHSYQASARMISTVDNMLGALLDAV